MESAQTGCARKAAFGEVQQTFALRGQLHEFLLIRDARRKIIPFDETGIKSTKQTSDEPLLFEFMLRDEAYRRWHDGSEDDDVKITGVIGYENSTRQIERLCFVLKLDIDARQLQEQP